MDRQPHDYAAAMAFAQQQQQQQQQMFGFQRHPQQQFAPHGAAFVPAHTHPSLQHFPFPHHLPPQQLHPHHLLHLQQQQQQQPPPSLGAFPPHHLPPHMGPPPHFHQSFDAMTIPAPAPPPSDPELQKRIDKLVEYAAKNGPEFEAMIRDKQRDNPAYSFLFGADGHSYYRYKLWLTTRPSDAAHFGPIISSPVNPMLNPAALSPVHLGMGAHPLHQGYQSSYDQHQMPPHTQHYMGPGQGEYDKPTNSFKGLSGPLPSDVASELHGVLNSLTGTKESIKGAKMWFMQRSPFAPALAEALKERVFATDDSEKQLHIVFLANDILFDSLQRRSSLGDLDNEALAFKPVIGSMLARIYNNPHNKDANQSRLEKILQFWAAKEVYNQDTIRRFESEMTGGALPVHFGIQEAARSFDSTGLQTEAVHASNQWLPDKHQESIPGSIDQQLVEKSPSISQFVSPSTSLQSSMYSSANAAHFPGALPNQSPLLAAALQPSLPHLPSTTVGAVEQSKPPPYPLFPPGLIPGMVRKMQIGSGVPYSPMSPLDIPTVIPPSTASESDILERVSKFFKEVGEATPSEGPILSSGSNINQNNYERDEYERDVSVRKGGACIPPPVNLHHMDPETGANAEGSMEQKHGSSSGRLGLGATDDTNEVSQYDDVYSSYRKQRSTNYHSSMSVRSATR